MQVTAEDSRTPRHQSEQSETHLRVLSPDELHMITGGLLAPGFHPVPPWEVLPGEPPTTVRV
jgi:hypothetical protein